MAWDDTKTDGVSNLPGAEYNTMVSAIKNQAYTMIVYKEGANYIAKNGATGAIISTNTDFSTVCQAAGDAITSRGTIFVKDPGSAISVISGMTFLNKEIFITSDWAKLDFSSLNTTVFLFQDTVQAAFKICGISKFRLKGDATKTSQIFAKFYDLRGEVDNLLATDPDFVGNFVTLYGGCYNSRLTNISGQAYLPIEMYGTGDGTHEPTGSTISHCDLYSRTGSSYIIKITNGYDITIKDNYLEGLTPVPTIIYLNGSQKVFIEGNYINFYTTIGIDCNSVNNSIITGNHFNPVADGAIGIETGGFYAPVITGNIFSNGPYDNVTFISLGTGNCVRANISGNIFYNESSGITGCKAISSTGTAHNIPITGNTFYNQSSLTGTAISLNNFYYSTITGNTFYNWSTPINITSNIDVIIANNYGYKTENWGSSTGTGAQQTIAHGLAATPTLVMLSDKEIGANAYQSATADATNIYITAIINQNYQWYVKT